jgi:hypothetical protein
MIRIGSQLWGIILSKSCFQVSQSSLVWHISAFQIHSAYDRITCEGRTVQQQHENAKSRQLFGRGAGRPDIYVCIYTYARMWYRISLSLSISYCLRAPLAFVFSIPFLTSRIGQSYHSTTLSPSHTHVSQHVPTREDSSRHH